MNESHDGQHPVFKHCNAWQRLFTDKVMKYMMDKHYP